MSDMRVSPGASHRAGGPGAWSRAQSDQAGARLCAQWNNPSNDGKLITDAIDNLEASIDEGGQLEDIWASTQVGMLATRPKLWKSGNFQALRDEAKAHVLTLSVLA